MADPITLADVQVGQFAFYVLGGGPRVAEVKALYPGRHPEIGVKPFALRQRKPNRVGLYAVVFVGGEDEAKAAAARYTLVHHDRADEVDRAKRRLANAQTVANDLAAAVERQAREAAQRVPHG